MEPAIFNEAIKSTNFHNQQESKQSHIQHSNEEDTKQLDEESIYDDYLYMSDDDQDDSTGDGETTTSATSEHNMVNLNINNNTSSNIGGKKRKKFDSSSETSDKSSSNRRTSIAVRERRLLEAYFAELSRPTSEQLQNIAEKLQLDKQVVRIWYCNRRQMEKRLKYPTNLKTHHNIH